MRISIVLAALAASLLVLGWTNPASARQVCVPFAQTETTMMDAKFINACFQADHVVKIKTIYSGKSGNMVEVILRDGTWFFKNAMTKAEMQRCVAGGSCDRYQNVKLRDLTRGDVSIFKKKRLHTDRNPIMFRERNRCAVGNYCG
jgi:hypothetical protein